jgi:hypothetical protein
LKCGICGEHGGEPSSVEFCHKVGLNYVSPVLHIEYLLQDLQQLTQLLNNLNYISENYIASKFGPKGTDYTGNITDISDLISSYYSNYEISELPNRIAKNIIKMGFESYYDYIKYLKK